MSQEEQTIKLDQRDVLDAAMTAGHILLENGAEIFRVEETIDRICHHFGVQSENAFVLSNGIFLTSGDEHEKRFARVEHIPVRGAQLHRVAAVNQLSREIEEGKYTLPEIREKLEQIRNAPGASKRALVLMSGLGSGCFCLMFGGMWQDCVAAFVIGCLLYLYLLWLNGRCSKIVENIGGGIIITVCSLLFIHMPFEMDMSHMNSGSIMPLVPGLAFTNGIRDIADGDYISGTVRMIDAVLVFLSVAAGVGCVLSIYHHLPEVSCYDGFASDSCGWNRHGRVRRVIWRAFQILSLLRSDRSVRLGGLCFFVDADGLLVGSGRCLFGDSAGYSDVTFFCRAGTLPGDDFFNLRHFTARAGSRNILDVLLPGDGTAGRSFYPRIFRPQSGGCDCAWNCVRI